MNTNQNTEFEEKTRNLFHELHKVQADSPYIFKRLATLLSPEYLKVDENFFQDKECLDAGCGSNANATYNMLKMGAKKVTAFDLNETIFQTAPKCLAEFEGKYELRVDNVLKIDQPDNRFDFVHCSGVLHHSSDVLQGVKELHRVTKPGGMIFLETYGKGGIVRDINTLFRDKYNSESEFKDLVDNLTPEFFLEMFEWLFSSMKKQGDNFGDKISKDVLNELFDEDLVLTIKDRITAPAYHENSEAELIGFLKGLGCSEIERISRYPYLKNVRRLMCPMYDEYDNKYSRLFYGDGQVQLRVIK